MEETSRHSDQEQDLIYALDIGTRSVIGLLARQEQDKMRVLEVERRPHERRTMLDGQIEDIRQVAKVVLRGDEEPGGAEAGESWSGLVWLRPAEP